MSPLAALIIGIRKDRFVEKPSEPKIEITSGFCPQ
jgi:hypothetical protein